MHPYKFNPLSVKTTLFASALAACTSGRNIKETLYGRINVSKERTPANRAGPGGTPFATDEISSRRLRSGCAVLRLAYILPAVIDPAERSGRHIQKKGYWG